MSHEPELMFYPWLLANGFLMQGSLFHSPRFNGISVLRFFCCRRPMLLGLPIIMYIYAYINICIFFKATLPVSIAQMFQVPTPQRELVKGERHLQALLL